MGGLCETNNGRGILGPGLERGQVQYRVERLEPIPVMERGNSCGA